MNTKYFFHKIGGYLMAALLVFGVAAVSGGTAQAQRRGRAVIVVRPSFGYGFRRPFGWYGGYGYGYYPYGYGAYSHYVFSSDSRAENQGFDDGVRTGADDGRKNKSYDPERSHYFQEAGFGNFADAYRNGFDRGYSEGYRNGGRG